MPGKHAFTAPVIFPLRPLAHSSLIAPSDYDDSKSLPATPGVHHNCGRFRMPPRRTTRDRALGHDETGLQRFAANPRSARILAGHLLDGLDQVAADSSSGGARTFPAAHDRASLQRVAARRARPADQQRTTANSQNSMGLKSSHLPGISVKSERPTEHDRRSAFRAVVRIYSGYHFSSYPSTGRLPRRTTRSPCSTAFAKPWAAAGEEAEACGGRNPSHLLIHRFSGGRCRIRTCDLLGVNQTL